MGTYNIYGSNNGNDGGPVVATITLDESDTEIISVTSDDPGTQAEAESVLRNYMGIGFAARDAIARYAGSYGEVQEIGPDGEVIPRAKLPDRPSAGRGHSVSPVIVEGDIVDQAVDAIVNAANEDLAGGAGVCGAIFNGAGWTEMAQACRELAPCPTGEARTTPGFALDARWVIHAVGPMWQGGSNGEEALLRSTYRSSLAEAARVGARSIAFPVLSTGIYGYPLDAGCRVAWEELTAAPVGVSEIRIVAFDDRTAHALAASSSDVSRRRSSP